MASPALPGLFFCVAAVVLLIFATVSVPVWDAIYFLRIFANGQETRFGVFGYTGSDTQVGYYITPEVLGFDNNSLNSALIHNLTSILILHPIAAALAAIAAVFGLCGAGNSRIGTILMSLAAFIATLATGLVWVIDMVLFGIARNRVRNDGPPGSWAEYGNANWMVLGAFIALLLGFCTGACGSFMSFRRRRTTVEKV